MWPKNLLNIPYFCRVSNFKILKIGWFCKTKSKNVLVKKIDFPYKCLLITMASDKTWCFVKRNCKSGYHIQNVAKAWFVIREVRNDQPKIRIELWYEVHPTTWHITSLLACQPSLFLKYIICYNYTHTSKQKFPFVLEAKEGYLSIPTMSYSWMDIARLRNTKSQTKVVPSCKVTGFHITAPLSPTL